MRSIRRKAAVAPNLLLAVFLIAAQSLVSAHVLEHDTGNLQNPVCTTCVAASQLGAATIDSGTSFEDAGFDFDLRIAAVDELLSRHVIVTRQRGPPAPL